MKLSNAITLSAKILKLEKRLFLRRIEVRRLRIYELLGKDYLTAEEESELDKYAEAGYSD